MVIYLISREEILNLAHLSRLDFTEDDLPKLTQDIGNLMKFAEKVSQHDLTNADCECQIVEHLGEKDVDFDYEKCDRNEILSGGISKEGFFFIKK